MADELVTFLPEDDFPDDLDPAATLDVLDARLRDPNTAPPDLIITEQDLPPMGRSWAFDFTVNRFVTRSSGVATTHGIQTLRQWIEQALRTDQGAHPIHSDNYGMVRPFDAIGEPLGSVTSMDIEQRISDALTFHQRIVGIQDFRMSYDANDDYLLISFTAVLSDDQLLSISDLRLP
jgi:hypothetical protein